MPYAVKLIVLGALLYAGIYIKFLKLYLPLLHWTKLVYLWLFSMSLVFPVYHCLRSV